MFIAVNWALTAGLFALALLAGQEHWTTAEVVCLVALGALSSPGAGNTVDTRIQLSYISIVLLAAAAMLGPAGAGLVGLVAAGIRVPGSWVTWRGRLFNMSMLSTVGLLSGFVYHAVGGVSETAGLQGPRAVVTEVGIPLLVADVAQIVANALLLSGVIRLSRGVSLRRQMQSLLGTMGVTYLAHGVLAFLLVVLWGPAQVGWFSAVLVMVPLLAAQWTFVQFGDQMRAHERTVQAVVAAIELRLPNRPGHAARVGGLAQATAQAMGMPAKEVSAVRVAGLVHDLAAAGLTGPQDAGTDVSGPDARRVGALEQMSVLSEAMPHVRGLPQPAGSREAAVEVVAVCDAVDALIAGTLSHAPRPVSAAFARLSREPDAFPAEVVRACEQAIRRDRSLVAEVPYGTAPDSAHPDHVATRVGSGR